MPKYSMSRQKINVDNKARFRYLNGYWFRLPRQIALHRALAVEPSKTILSNRYIPRHDLGSIGGVQSALKKLKQIDLVEIDAESRYQVVDPIFSIWLCSL